MSLSDTDREQEDPRAVYWELYDRIRKTAGIRFIAARRLAIHQKLSQWVIALSSTALIAIPLLQVFAVSVSYSAQQLAALQVFLAVCTLAYSLLLTQENFAVRSERMHLCGIELSLLANELQILDGSQVEERYRDATKRYDEILRRSENHAELDHQFYKLRKHDYTGWAHGLSLRIRVCVFGLLSVVQYVIPLAILSLVLLRTTGYLTHLLR